MWLMWSSLIHYPVVADTHFLGVDLVVQFEHKQNSLADVVQRQWDVAVVAHARQGRYLEQYHQIDIYIFVFMNCK